MPRYDIETTIRVFDNDEGGYVEIGPDQEGNGQIHISIKNGPVKDMGSCDMNLEPEMAVVLAEALTKLALELVEKRNQNGR